jgi:hypothetical protein
MSLTSDSSGDGLLYAHIFYLIAEHLVNDIVASKGKDTWGMQKDPAIAKSVDLFQRSSLPDRHFPRIVSKIVRNLRKISNEFVERGHHQRRAVPGDRNV